MLGNIIDKLRGRCETLAIDKARAVFLLRELRESKTTWFNEEHLRKDVDDFLAEHDGWFCERCSQIVAGVEVTFDEHNEKCGGRCSPTLKRSRRAQGVASFSA